MHTSWVDHLTLNEIEKIKEATNTGFVDKIRNAASLVSLNYSGGTFNPQNDNPSGEIYVQAGMDVERLQKNSSKFRYLGIIEIHDEGFTKAGSPISSNKVAEVYKVVVDKNFASEVSFPVQHHDVSPSKMVNFYNNSVLSAVKNALEGRKVKSARELPKLRTDLLEIGKREVVSEVLDRLISSGFKPGQNCVVSLPFAVSDHTREHFEVNPFKGIIPYENYMSEIEVPVSDGSKTLRDLETELLKMERSVFEGIAESGLKYRREIIQEISTARGPR
jgi:hypothetical protein